MKNSKRLKTHILLRSLKNPFVFVLALACFGLGYKTHELYQSQFELPVVQSTQGISCKVCFTPTQPCVPLIVKEIKSAQKTICMQVYSFTSVEIAQALLEAHNKGIIITLIADKSQKTDPYSQITKLSEKGISVFFDTQPAIAHSKIIIIDEKKVITGSYNFTKAAERRNAENLLVLTSPEIAKQYLENFKRRLAVSVSQESLLPILKAHRLKP